MKALIIALTCAISLFISMQTVAGCYEAGRFVNCCKGSPYTTECQCTDPNVIRENSCMSKDKYCEAFGNVGAR